MTKRRPKLAQSPAGLRRMTSKGQITIPSTLRRRFNITTHTILQFIPQSDGFVVAPATEGAFKELAGSASKHWTLDEILNRLDQLRKENA
jgi:bifunctional DNA-binding transcriptional regulator/antitoxin component of YhaV-PrlF toxin-antitoxin module